MAATAAEEQAFIDGTHPALSRNSEAMATLRSGSPTRSPSPSSSSSSSSNSPRFSAIDPSPPTTASPPLRGGGASNTGPKGVLADYQARGEGVTTKTGPKGVLADYEGSRAASAKLPPLLAPPSATIISLGPQDEEKEEDEDDEWGLNEIEDTAWKRKRAAELSGSGSNARRRRFGHLREVGEEQFLKAVDEEGEDVTVVVCLYEPHIPTCTHLNTHLSSLARLYPYTKFLRARATAVDFSFADASALPTLIVYKGGDVVGEPIVRVDREWGEGTREDIRGILISLATPPSRTATANSDDNDDDARPPSSLSPEPPSSGAEPIPPPRISSLKHQHHHHHPQQPPPNPNEEPLRPLRPRPHPPPPAKGILKPPSVQQARFNFRRDILNPFNTRLGYAVEGVVAGSGVAAGVPGPGGAVAASVGGVAAAAGGFWGSALKRLGNVTGANVVGVRDLSEDTVTTTNNTLSGTADHTQPTTTSTSNTAGSGGAFDGHPHPHPSHAHPHHPHQASDPLVSGPAPHTPSKGLPSSSPATSTPYVTATLRPTPSTTIPPAAPPLSVTELKKVRFRMASLKVVYPINNGLLGAIAPWEEGRTRKRINTEYRLQRHRRQEEGGETKGWTGEDLGRLYLECCRTREESGIERVKRAFRENPRLPPKTLDLSNELLSHGAVEALSDLLAIDFGLKKLTLENCGLDDESLKPLLHALLVSACVPTLSLANNKRVRAKGWKMIAIFARKAKFLRYLDLSENNFDKKAADYLVQALTPYTPPSSTTPSNEDPPTSVPEVPAKDPSSSTTTTAHPVPHPQRTVASEPSTTISNYPEDTPHRPLITGLGITSPLPDEEEPPPPAPNNEGYLDDDDSDQEKDPEPLFSVAPLLKDGSLGETKVAESASLLSLRLENCGLRSGALEALAHGVRSSPLKHISIRRNKINALGAVAVAIMIRDFPVASDHSSDQLPIPAPSPSPAANGGFFEASNSVTARQTLQAPYVRRTPLPTPAPIAVSAPSAVEEVKEAAEGKQPSSTAAQVELDAWKNSEARNRLRKQIEELPRTGSLLTLDVKGNDIKNGVTYISQVLKRNRTLKVLNLSENKIDVQGLVSIAEALKYNSTLETLDMSLNPCCGPGLEGITALRAAITINSNLKRVFLNNTDLSSEGAIALAEFLPEAKSLIHLDLTGNFDIDIAGALALSVSVKMNNTIRCLDLNIPANDPDFARLSQEILQCCVRNTELAQEESFARGNKVQIAAPILKSAVARDLKNRQDQEERVRQKELTASKTKDEIVTAAEECHVVLSDLLAFDVAAKAQGVIVAPSEVVKDLLVQAQLAEAQVAEAVAATAPGPKKDRASAIGDRLTSLLDLAKITYGSEADESRLKSPVSPQQAQGNGNGGLTSPTVAAPPEPISSPSFSIADSDEEDDDSASTGSPSPAPNDPSTSHPAMPSISIPNAAVDLEREVDHTVESPKSPMESQSRSLTLEEGEVFRKGQALETAEDEELADVSGEELRKEILETEVQRSPRPSVGSSDGARPDQSFFQSQQQAE
ncbi:RNI-like protein [Meredithblackwellia eburnea MCA 4105]